MAPGASLEEFKEMVYLKVQEAAQSAFADAFPTFSLSEKINAILDPYAIWAEQQLYVNCAPLPQDIRALAGEMDLRSGRDLLVLITEHLMAAPQPQLRELDDEQKAPHQ